MPRRTAVTLIAIAVAMAMLSPAAEAAKNERPVLEPVPSPIQTKLTVLNPTYRGSVWFLLNIKNRTKYHQVAEAIMNETVNGKYVRFAMTASNFAFNEPQFASAPEGEITLVKVLSWGPINLPRRGSKQYAFALKAEPEEGYTCAETTVFFGEGELENDKTCLEV